ncbi:tetratricopeptide repeat protein [Kaarinaea lacus]
MKTPNHTLRTALAGMVLGFMAFQAQASSYEEGLIAYTTGNFAKAGKHLVTAAEKGEPGAEQLLMRLFAEGHLTTKNQEIEILKWTRKAAEKGIMQAQYAMGDLYARQPETMADAVKWFRHAAEQGHPDAFFKLGEILKNGALGVAANAEESNRMYLIAASEFTVFAQKGNPHYQYSLGNMYQLAKGVEKDMTIALKWISKSAMQGHALAQLALGRLYANGIEVPHDPRQARYWLDMAAAQGHEEAVTALEEFETEATVAYAM